MSARSLLYFVLLLSLSACAQTPDASEDSGALQVDIERREVRVPARVDRSRFQGAIAQAMKMDGYHLLVSEHGGAARYGLFTTQVADRAIYDALATLSGDPGEGLPIATWSERNDAAHPAPDLVAAGHAVSVSVIWEGSNVPVSPAEFLEDPTGRGFNFVFAGNLANIPVWKSGCGICLVSCPGGKIVNAAYTVRDYVSGQAAFHAIRDSLPSDGNPVTVILRVD